MIVDFVGGPVTVDVVLAGDRAYLVVGQTRCPLPKGHSVQKCYKAGDRLAAECVRRDGCRLHVLTRYYDQAGTLTSQVYHQEGGWGRKLASRRGRRAPEIIT